MAEKEDKHNLNKLIIYNEQHILISANFLPASRWGMNFNPEIRHGVNKTFKEKNQLILSVQSYHVYPLEWG